MLTAYLILFAIAVVLGIVAMFFLKSSSPAIIEPLVEKGGIPSPPQEMSSESEFVETVSRDGLTLVDCYATWCGPCNTLHPIIENLSTLNIKSLKILKVDVDFLNSVASMYRVRSVPTLLLFRNGELVWRYSGVAGLGELKTAISRFQKTDL